MSSERSAPADALQLAVSGGVTRFAVWVQPRAARTEVSGVRDGALKVRVAAPPVDGAANAELITYLAKRLRVPKASVRIVKGKSTRQKIIEVEGVSAEDVRELLP